MKTYEYEGFDKANKKPSNGTVQAQTGEEAILYLLQSGIYPTELIELSSGQVKSNNHLNNLKRFRERLRAPVAVPPEQKRSSRSKSNWSFLAFLGWIILFVVLVFFVVKQFVRI